MTRKEILQKEYDTVLTAIVKAEIDIGVLERVNGETVIARKPGAKDKDGKVISWIGVNARGVLDQSSKDLEQFNLRLKVIDGLLSKEKWS